MTPDSLIGLLSGIGTAGLIIWLISQLFSKPVEPPLPTRQDWEEIRRLPHYSAALEALQLWIKILDENHQLNHAKKVMNGCLSAQNATTHSSNSSAITTASTAQTAKQGSG